MGFTPVNKGELNCRCHVGGKVALMKRCLFVQTCTPDLMSTTCPRFHYIPRRKKNQATFTHRPVGWAVPQCGGWAAQHHRCPAGHKQRLSSCSPLHLVSHHRNEKKRRRWFQVPLQREREREILQAFALLPVIVVVLTLLKNLCKIMCFVDMWNSVYLRTEPQKVKPDCLRSQP